MSVALQVIALALGGIYNGILTYETYADRKGSWRMIGSGLTAIGLFIAAAIKAGLIGLSNT